MLEITARKYVTTRKVHNCYACERDISAGIQAVSATTMEDANKGTIHFHDECNTLINKNKHLLQAGIYRGCIAVINKHKNWLKSV